MIFGQTTEQRLLAINKQLKNTAETYFYGKKLFAYLPVNMEDGRFLWLSYYWKRYSDAFSYYEVVETGFLKWGRLCGHRRSLMHNYYTPRTNKKAD